MSLAAPPKRIASVDILRGIIMVIMALDHTRDYFTDFHDSPTNLATASSAMFLTRWITHFCAPLFIFLSGASTMLSLSKGKTKREMAFTLLTRGAWLIILEVTIIRFGWLFNIDYSLIIVQVIWTIGWSMIFLAGLIFLPLSAIAIIALTLILGHNMLDSIHAKQFAGWFGLNPIWWNLVHEQGFIPWGDGNKNVLGVIYPLVPWIGVMAAGYCFGTILQMPKADRDSWMRTIGIYAIGLFAVLRLTNFYGEPIPWHYQKQWWRTILSIIDCTKYPPSLCYLLMTIGPAVLIMPWLEQFNNQLTKFFRVFGRVPLFYYILHIYLLHTMAMVTGIVIGMPYSYFTTNNFIFNPSADWGFPLDMVYAFWLVAVLLLYYPCRWFMNVKMYAGKWWLSYL